ncbi:MAG: SMI1/KNR4 family protein [Pirellulales bacterium]
MDYSTPIFDRLQDCWDPISENQLARLEADLGVDYPEQYRDFLLRFNAGDWAHRVSFRVLHPTRCVNQIHLGHNLGIVPDEQFAYADIRHAAEVFHGRVPHSFVSVMSDGSNPICMEMAEENCGKIYFWDRDNEGSEENLEYLIADSFMDFLSCLSPASKEASYQETLPVFQAAERGDRKAVLKYLMDCGKPDIRNAKGWTLLMCAARNSWPKIVEMLYNGGAKPNALDPDGWSPLHHAVWGQSLDSVKHLLAAGADTDYRDSQGRNLAQIAKEEHHYRLYYHLAPYMPYP